MKTLFCNGTHLSLNTGYWYDILSACINEDKIYIMHEYYCFVLFFKTGFRIKALMFDDCIVDVKELGGKNFYRLSSRFPMGDNSDCNF